MKFIKIENYVCKACGNEEYSVIDLNEVICICSKCGKQVGKNEFKIEIEEVEE